MGKYDPLEGHLRRQKTVTYEMTFRDIERVLGGLLPKGAQRPEWWANEQNPATRHMQRHAWLRAGFRATPHNDAETVRFDRMTPAADA